MSEPTLALEEVSLLPSLISNSSLPATDQSYYDLIVESFLPIVTELVPVPELEQLPSSISEEAIPIPPPCGQVDVGHGDNHSIINDFFV